MTKLHATIMPQPGLPCVSSEHLGEATVGQIVYRKPVL